jgi:hypothetical protein
MRIGVALGVILAGCYAPQPQAGAPCPDGVCPSGLVCSPATTTCETHAIDASAGHSDALLVDAPIELDARPIDGAAQNVPMLRQQVTNYADTAASLSATLPATPIAGHVLVMIGATPSGSLTTVSGGGVTWNLAAQSLINANEEIWWGVSDGTSATVTIARTANTQPMWLQVTEWSGLATTSTLIDAAADNGTTSPASAGSVTTTGPSLLVFAATNDKDNVFGSPTPGTWTTLPGIDAFLVQSEWYRVEPNAGTFTPTVTEQKHSWDAALAAFKYVP